MYTVDIYANEFHGWMDGHIRRPSRDDAILPQNALKRDRNSKCIDLIEGHYVEVVVLL